MKMVKKIFGKSSNVAIGAFLLSLMLVLVHMSDKYGYSNLLSPAPKKLVVVEQSD